MTYGSQQTFALVAKESTKGTAVSATKDLGIIREPTPSLSREIKEIQSIGAADVQQIETGINDPKWSGVFEFQNGRSLEMALGGVSHAQTSSDWKHTFTITDDLSTWTIDTNYDAAVDTVIRHIGSMLENLEIGCELNGVLTCTGTWRVMKTDSNASADSRVISTLVTLPHSLCHVDIGGSEAAEVQKFSITIENTVPPTDGFNSNIHQNLTRTAVKFKFKGTLGFNAKTFWELAQGGSSLATGTPAATTIKLYANNGVTLGSGRREFVLDLKSCQFDNFEKVVSVGDLVFANVAGTGLLNSCFSVDNISNSNW